tara:strand:+ start:1884 stop:6476 length:4593 start_codon:yes stop_codon:yes gene_type:complete
MSDSAQAPISDIWFDNWDELIKRKFGATYRLEEAWEYFQDHYDDGDPANNDYLPAGHTFKSRIQSAVLSQAQFNSQKIGRTFDSIDDVKRLLGSSIPNTGNDAPSVGTNYIAQQTKWRRFGLMSGFNVGSAVPHTFKEEDLTDPRGPFRKFMADFEETMAAIGMRGENAEDTSVEAQGSGTGTTTVEGKNLEAHLAIRRFREVGDPRFRSELIGHPEPSVLNTTTHVDDSRNWGYVPGGDPIREQTTADPDGTDKDSVVRMFYGRSKIQTLKGNNSILSQGNVPMNYGHFTGPAVREFFLRINRTSIVDEIDGVRTDLATGAKRLLQPIIDEIKIAEQLNSGGDASGASAGVLPQPKQLWWAGSPTPPIYKQYSIDGDVSSSPDAETPRWTDGSIIPSQILVWPTLPLDSLMTAEEEDHLFEILAIASYLTGPFQLPLLAAGAAAAQAGLITEEDTTGTARSAKLMTSDIRSFWYGAYEKYEGGSSKFNTLENAIKTDLVEQTRHIWNGHEVGSVPYKKLFRETLEIILDFFGAGTQPDPTSDQEVQEGAKKGINSQFYTPEQLDKMLGFKVLKPLDMQCFLMENIDRISELQERTSTYTNVVQLYGEPGTTISKINHGGRTDEIRQLLNLSPAVYALLVPYIKLYRVDYSEAIKDEEGKTLVKPKPVAQYEIPIPNFIDATDIRPMTGADGYGRLRGFGLQSFTWKLDGVQPAEVDNNISANLKFHFQSVNDLFQGSAKIRDDGSFAGYSAGHVPNPLDLLISSKTMSRESPLASNGDDPSNTPKPPRCKSAAGNIQEDYDGAYFRIKIVAGWASPPNIKELMPDASPNQITQLTRALETTRISLYLQQIRHDLNFNPDGTVQLSIDYQAALVGLLTSKKADILGVRDRDMKAALDAVGARVKSADDDDLSKEELEELMEKKKDLENEDRLKKYRRFLSALYGRSDDGCKTKTTKMYTIQVSKDLLSQPRLDDIKDAAERAEYARQRMSANASSRGFSIRNQSDMAGGTGANTDLLALVNKGINEGASTQDVGDSAAGDMMGQWENQVTDNDDVRIPYFYLGDLIDTILENHQDVTSNENVDPGYMTFLSDVDIVNPLVLFQSENALDLACANNIDDASLARSLREKGYVFSTDPDTGSSIKKRINIGSIPISLDLFNVWYKNNVIKKSRNRYYLMHFLKDLCSGLISAALKKNCFSNNIVNQVRFDTSVINFNNSSRKIKKGKVATVSDLAEAKGALDETNDIPDRSSFDNYLDWVAKHYNTISGLILYSTDAKPANRTGNYEDDLKAGIYHNYIGSSAGILKSLKFSREDQAYLREAKIQKIGALGAEQLRELYSVSMEMVGNTLFKNGQYTFVWPTLIASDDAYAKLLGLGGYFLITGVDHNLSSQGYTVSVKALQEGLRMGTDEIVTAEAVRGTGAGAPSPDENPSETDAEFRERTELAEETEELFGDEPTELDMLVAMSDEEKDAYFAAQPKSDAELLEEARASWENRTVGQRFRDWATFGGPEAPPPARVSVPIQHPSDNNTD